MNPRYPWVALCAGHRCEYCRAPEAVFNLPFEVEHIVPVSRGGADDEGNWALACRSCNLHKGDRTGSADPETSTTSRLFHPRRDDWAEHFSIAGDTGEISGHTAVARATVACLRLNSSAQIAGRQVWIRLGLFP